MRFLLIPLLLSACARHQPAPHPVIPVRDVVLAAGGNATVPWLYSEAPTLKPSLCWSGQDANGKDRYTPCGGEIVSVATLGSHGTEPTHATTLILPLRDGALNVTYVSLDTGQVHGTVNLRIMLEGDRDFRNILVRLVK